MGSQNLWLGEFSGLTLPIAHRINEAPLFNTTPLCTKTNGISIFLDKKILVFKVCGILRWNQTCAIWNLITFRIYQEQGKETKGMALARQGKKPSRRLGKRLLRFCSKNILLVLLVLALLALIPPIFFHFRLKRFHQVLLSPSSSLNDLSSFSPSDLWNSYYNQNKSPRYFDIDASLTPNNLIIVRSRRSDFNEATLCFFFLK